MAISDQMIRRELQSQNDQWGLQHDVEEHGSAGLAEVAALLVQPNCPDWDREGYDEEQWFVQLRKKHENDPARRYAIAAAMLRNAIECLVYEQGRDSVCKLPSTL